MDTNNNVLEKFDPKEFDKMEPATLVNLHRQLHYQYANRCVEPSTKRTAEKLHTDLVSAMKDNGVGHMVSTELDASLPEILQNIHVSVYYESMRYVKAMYVSDFAQVLDNVRGLKILDVGCGIGLAMRILENSGFEVQGLDNSPTAIYYCKNKGLTVRRGEASQFPFSDDSFDTVYSMHLLEYLDNYHKVILESLRVMRKVAVHIVPFGKREGSTHANEWRDYTIMLDNLMTIVPPHYDVKVSTTKFNNGVIVITEK